MKGLGLKLLKIHLLFLSFLPIFIDRTRDGKNGTKTGFYPVLVQMCAPVQTIPRNYLCCSICDVTSLFSLLSQCGVVES
jgi:hypothetical protein